MVTLEDIPNEPRWKSTSLMKQFRHYVDKPDEAVGPLFQPQTEAKV
jgi:hypothetical protein